MALRYLLNDFAQGTDATAPVRVEVQVYDGTIDPDSLVGGLPCAPIDGAALGPAWTNEQLRAAVEKETGKAIELPAALAPRSKKKKRR